MDEDEKLDAIPLAWTAGLVRLRGKKPIDNGFNSIAAARWKRGCPDDWRTSIEAHLAKGGNVGLVPPPGIVVLDCDNADAIEWVANLAPADTPWSVRTSESAHAWLRYELPSGVDDWLSKGLHLLEGAKLDLRVAGKSQAVVPPSRHESGFHSFWERPLPATPELVPMMPEEMMRELMEAGGVPPRENVEVPDGINAHDTVRDWIMSRVDSADSLDDLRQLARQFAEYYVKPKRADRYAEMADSRELEDLVTGAWSRRGGNDLPRVVEMGIGDDRFVFLWNTLFEEKWAHVGEWSPEGVWTQWDGVRWQHTPQFGHDGFYGAVRRFMDRLKYVRDHDSPLKVDHNDYCLTLDRMRAELARQKSAASPMTRLKEALSVSGGQFDARPHLWTCPPYDKIEGPRTLDLKSRRIRPTDSDDWITRIGGAAYVNGTRSDLWEEFVQDAFPNEKTRRFVQVCAGYSMLADPREDIVLFLIGRGGSGKSTFIGTLERVFGDYAGFVPAVEIDDNMPGAGAGGTNASLLALRGKRIATCTELPEKVRLGAKLKALSGGDQQTGRGLYSKMVSTFRPQFVLWLGGNLQPQGKAVDSGLTRRMRYIPMDNVPKHPDITLKDRLRKPIELAGVLNWVLEGLQMYIQDGIMIQPEAVRARSLRARVEASDIGPWLRTRVVKDPGFEGFTPTRGYDAFVDWFVEQNHGRRGLPIKSVTRFGEEMRALGYKSTHVRSKGKNLRMYKGIRILSDREMRERADQEEDYDGESDMDEDNRPYKSKKSKVFHATGTEKLWRLFMRECDRQGLSMAQGVRIAVTDWVRKWQKHRAARA